LRHVRCACAGREILVLGFLLEERIQNSVERGRFTFIYGQTPSAKPQVFEKLLSEPAIGLIAVMLAQEHGRLLLPLNRQMEGRQLFGHSGLTESISPWQQCDQKRPAKRRMFFASTTTRSPF
jgi:hypothetical protein